MVEQVMMQLLRGGAGGAGGPGGAGGAGGDGEGGAQDARSTLYAALIAAALVLQCRYSISL